MRYMVAGVLVVVAAGACRAESPNLNPVRPRMSETEVNAVLGRPDNGNFFFNMGGYANYRQVDWLGGEQMTHVVFDAELRAVSFSTRYSPFAVTPPWLAALHSAAVPVGK
jgi:hypothetical protein